MRMETALRGRLVADAAVAAFVGARVYPRIRPQGSALPALVLTIVADPRPQHLEDFHPLRATRVQIDCWSTSYTEAAELREAVIAAVVPRAITEGRRFDRGRINLVMDRGEDTAAGFIHVQMIDATIWHGQTE